MAGPRVLVTRAAHQAGKLSDALRAAGLEPVEVPVLEIRPPLDCGPLDGALRRLDIYDWLIVTSVNTVRALQDRATALSSPLDQVPGLKVAAVGEATAAAARKAGLAVSAVPENYVAESLVEKLLVEGGNASGRGFPFADSGEDQNGALAPDEGFSGQRILFARAEIAREVIPVALRAAGATVDVVDAYRNVMPSSAPEMLRRAFDQGIDAVTFTSSSSVNHLADAARAAGFAFPFPGVKAISIGPITSATLREEGWEPAAEAACSSISGLVEAILHILR